MEAHESTRDRHTPPTLRSRVCAHAHTHTEFLGKWNSESIKVARQTKYYYECAAQQCHNPLFLLCPSGDPQGRKHFPNIQVCCKFRILFLHKCWQIMKSQSFAYSLMINMDLPYWAISLVKTWTQARLAWYCYIFNKLHTFKKNTNGVQVFWKETLWKIFRQILPKTKSYNRINRSVVQIRTTVIIYSKEGETFRN